jgi:hypothetical protein
MSLMQRQTVVADKYVQAPISRLPSGDLTSSGMSFMQGGAAMTGGALGSDPATWTPVSKGGRLSLAGMRKRGELDKFGPKSGLAGRAEGGRMSLAGMRKRGGLDKFGPKSGLAGRAEGGRMSLAGMRKRGGLDKFGPKSGLAGRARARGAGACGGGRCRKGCECMGRGLFA